MSDVRFTSAADALGILAEQGFKHNFEPAGSNLRSRESGRVFRPDEMTVLEIHRFEGETDPADMSVVYALEAIDGERGTLVDAYGPYGRSEVGDALKAVKIREPRREVAPRQGRTPDAS